MEYEQRAVAGAVYTARVAGHEWSGAEPWGLPAHSLRACAADQERRIPGGGQAACGNRIGGRIRLRAW